VDVALVSTLFAAHGAGGCDMARYSRGAGKAVKSAMRRRKRGTLKSGRSGKTVRSRKQAIAIGLSEARKKGARVPRKKGGRR
jgi:hypothetical protein